MKDQSDLANLAYDVNRELMNLKLARQDMASIRMKLQQALNIDLNVYPHPTVNQMIDMLIAKSEDKS